MTWETLGEFIRATFLDEGKHFLLAFSLGSLAYALISIICYVLSCAWERLTHRRMSMAAVCFTVGLCLLAGVSVALLSHAWLDGFSLWYTSPLGPPLQINLGG